MGNGCNLAAKESGLQCTCVNSDNFTVLVSGGGRHPWVSMGTVWPSHSKWLSEESNESASNFALSLNIPLWNYLDDSEGRNYGKLVIGSFITTTHPLTHHILCRVFCWNFTSPRWQSPYSPGVPPCDFWLFPKLKSPLKDKRFQTMDKIQENMTG